jgi:hypothetical protein
MQPVEETITNIGNRSTNAQYVSFFLELIIPDSDSLAAHQCPLGGTAIFRRQEVSEGGFPRQEHSFGDS